MFCVKCGAQLNDDERYCYQCGASVAGQNQDTVSVNKQKQLWPFILIIAVVLLVLVGLLIYNFASGSTEKKYNDQLELAERYLDELDYDRAIAAYKEAIEIDPIQAEAYLGLAEVYVEQRKYQKAIDVLEDGYGKSGDERLADKIAEIEILIKAEMQPTETEPAPAEADAENDTEEEAEETWQEIDVGQIPEEERMVELLSRFAWRYYTWKVCKSTYDSSSPSTDYPDVYRGNHNTVINWIVNDYVSCIPYEDYPIEQPVVEWDTAAGSNERDPLNRFDSYISWKEESVDWILTNILNVGTEDREKMKKRWVTLSDDMQEEYYYEGSYYSFKGALGGGYDVIPLKVFKNGTRYEIIYDLYNYYHNYPDYPQDPYARRRAILELKTIDGGKYWSIYRDELYKE